ncbi:unnamed protein product [Bubo scandiacus]
MASERDQPSGLITKGERRSRPAPRPCGPVLSPATPAAGDLAGDVQPLAVTAAEQHAAASPAKGDRAGNAVAAGKVESPEGAGLGRRVLAPEGTAIAVEAAENPEAERVTEALARAAERIAMAEVAKVLQSAIAELKEKRRSTWLKPRNATQQEEEDRVKEGKVK